MSAQKTRNTVVASTVLVTVVPCTVIQEPVCLSHRMRRWSTSLSLSTSPQRLASLASSHIFDIIVVTITTYTKETQIQIIQCCNSYHSKIFLVIIYYSMLIPEMGILGCQLKHFFCMV